MATMKKPAKKMQMGGSKKSAPMMKKGGSVDTYTDYSGKTSKPDSYTQYKKGGVVKAKNGKSFPDLNKDGKITKADILKGRGVIAKSGAALKKQAAVAIAMKKDGKAPKKAGFGDVLSKVAGSGALGLAGMAANKLFGGKKKADASAAAPMKKGGKIAAKKKMQYGGAAASMVPPMMKKGGATKKCKYGCK